MIKSMYICEECNCEENGVLMPESYRLDPSNFVRRRIETNQSPAGIAIGMKVEEFVTCKKCEAKTNGFGHSLEVLLAPLRANKEGAK